MCIRPPCENCGGDYDACFSACLYCGHPNSQAPPPLNLPEELFFKQVVEEVPCKICKTNHTVTRIITVKKGGVGQYDAV